MEDTLRYFFSAVFQGFAAIITLGIMFYLYYLDKISNVSEQIKKELQRYAPDGSISNDGHKVYKEKGLIEYLNSFYRTIKKDIVGYGHVWEQVDNFYNLQKNKNNLSVRMKSLFVIARIILILSLISLFLVGYFEWLNYILEVIGIACIILAIIFFSNLYSFSKRIIDNPLG